MTDAATPSTPGSDFPILDAPYTNTPGRAILGCHGFISPYIDETDDWVNLPLRLVHSPTNGLHIEIGPYSLNVVDIRRLRDAINAYQSAWDGRLRDDR
jgi:hypothetical protein